MNMKKSAIAIAVTGAIGFPAAAAADANVYGRVDVGLETTTDPTSAFIFPGFNAGQNGNINEGETDFELNNGNQSRIGFTGSEELGSGWEVSTTIELEADILEDQGLGAGTRLGWIGFSNGPHSVTIGKQWQPAYEYAGWNVSSLPTHGHANYFKMLSYNLDAGTAGSTGATGYRQDSSIGYTFGGGGYSQDPFTADVLLGINNGGEAVNDGTEASAGTGSAPRSTARGSGLANEAGISSIQVFAAGTFGPDITINGGVIRDFRDVSGVDEVEPTLVTLGGRFPIGDTGFKIGTSLYSVDTDQPTGDESIEGGKITGFWTGPNGWSAELGFGTVDADEDTARSARVSSFAKTQTEVDSLHFMVKKQLSSRTHIRLVGETADVDQAIDNPNTPNTDESDDEGIDGSVFMLAVQHNF